MSKFRYRPAANLQFWYADVAYVPIEGWRAMYTTDYPIYAPPLMVSNALAEIARRRIAAFSRGAREFWVVRPDERPVSMLPGSNLPVRTLFLD